jgi:hypothetical protein
MDRDELGGLSREELLDRLVARAQDLARLQQEARRDWQQLAIAPPGKSPR